MPNRVIDMKKILTRLFVGIAIIVFAYAASAEQSQKPTPAELYPEIAVLVIVMDNIRTSPNANQQTKDQALMVQLLLMDLAERRIQAIECQCDRKTQ